MSKIEYRVEKSTIYCTLKQSILKQHFKSLMKLCWKWDWQTKTGAILCRANKAEQFKQLVAEIEQSDAAKCEASHNASIKKCATKRAKSHYDEHPNGRCALCVGECCCDNRY